MNPTLEIADGRSVLRFERRLAHPVEAWPSAARRSDAFGGS